MHSFYSATSGLWTALVLTMAVVGLPKSASAAEGPEASLTHKVARFSTGIPGRDDFEELSFEAANGERGVIDYAYGAERKTLRLTYEGRDPSADKPAFRLRFPNDLLLEVMRDHGRLQVTGKGSYSKTFSWEPPPNIDGGGGCSACADEAESFAVLDRYFVAGETSRSTAEKHGFFAGAYGTVFGTGGHIVTVIVLSASEDVCKTRERNFQRRNSSELVLQMDEGDDSEDDSENDSAAPSLFGFLDSFDENCARTQLEAKKVDINLTKSGEIKSGVYEGTYDVLFEDGRHLRGKFRAPLCKAMNQGIADIDKFQPEPRCR